MVIGSLGDVVFEVSSETVKSFDNYKRVNSSRWASHDIIGKKPVKEYLGPGLIEVGFSIKLSVFLGVSPEKELDALRSYCENGEIVKFIINNKPVIDNRWVIESLNENVLSWDNKGNMLVVDVEVALKEYPESGDKNGV